MQEERAGNDWRAICAMVSKEKDPARLLELVKRLNQVLDEEFGDSYRTGAAVDGGPKWSE